MYPLYRSYLLEMLPLIPTDFVAPTGNPTILNKIRMLPTSLGGPILTAVPGEAVADLMNPLTREEMASSFKAGDLPDWYNGLPKNVKGYFSEFAAQMTDSGVTYQPTGAIATGIPEGLLGNVGGESAASTALASRPTGAVAGGILVAAEVLGRAIAL
jgi:hypothetical protein